MRVEKPPWIAGFEESIDAPERTRTSTHNSVHKAIERDGNKVAQVSKRWFRVRDAYGIEIAPGEDNALILAVAACIDEMGGRR